MSEGKWGYNTLRAQGRCGWCGGAPIEGKSLCERCAKRAAEKNEQWRAKRRLGRPTDGHLGRLSDKSLAAAGRCVCGLLPPCHNCGPTIIELAGSRRGGE